MANLESYAFDESTKRLTLSLDEFAALASTADDAMRMLETCSDLDVSKRTMITLMLANMRDFVQTKLTDATCKQRKVGYQRDDFLAESYYFLPPRLTRKHFYLAQL